jgi:hypothetical protein
VFRLRGGEREAGRQYQAEILRDRYDLSIRGNILDTYGFQIKSPLHVGMSGECRGQKIANEGKPLLIDALAFPKRQENADLFNQE